MSAKARRWVRVLVALPVLAVLIAVGSFGWIWFSEASLDCRVGVFMYHAVVPDSQSGTRFEIRHSDFTAHLDQLQSDDVPVRPLSRDTAATSLSQLRDEWCSQSPVVALITFDAEVPSFHSELSVPELATRAMPATYFVVTGNLQISDWVSEDELEFMEDSGMLVGSHSHSHPLFTRIDSTEVRGELAESKAKLDSLGMPRPRVLAFPGGRYDLDILRIVREEGFRYSFTSDPCFLPVEVSDHGVCRIEVRGDGGPSPSEFLASPLAVARQSWTWKVKRTVENLLPRVVWDRVSALRY